MNANFYLQCKTCLKILRIRVQAGYYNWIPFTYECPECKVVCRGEITIPSQVSPEEKRHNPVMGNLKNCLHIKESDVGQNNTVGVLQLSSELYTEKITKDEGIFHLFAHLTPHLQYASSAINTETLQNLVTEILKEIYDKEDDYTAFWDLYENSSSYLRKKKKQRGVEKRRKKYLNENQKIGFLQDYLYKQIRKSDYYITSSDNILSKLKIIRKKKHVEFQKLAQIINDNFDKSTKKIFTVTSNFLNYYNYILPVILNEISQTYVINDIKDRLGMAQTDFEFLKTPYSENYEDLKDFIWILILINNIYYRDKIENFNPDFETGFKSNTVEKIKEDITKFNSQIRNVGNRKIILNYDDTQITINKVFDNEIRNSIDHRDYTYNYNEQLISFNNKDTPKRMYLIEFSDNLFQGFILANILWDVMMYIAKEENILK